MKIDINSNSTHSAVIVMRRTFDAPRDILWEALTEPRHVVKWYGGKGFENPVCEMDVRPGGRWRHTMRTPDGVEHAMEFVFVDVVKPEKLIWKKAESAKSTVADPSDNVMTVTLEADGNQTHWKLVSRFKSYADRDAAKKIGFASVLAEGTEKLDALVKELAREPRPAAR